MLLDSQIERRRQPSISYYLSYDDNALLGMSDVVAVRCSKTHVIIAYTGKIANERVMHFKAPIDLNSLQHVIEIVRNNFGVK